MDPKAEFLKSVHFKTLHHIKKKYIYIYIYVWFSCRASCQPKLSWSLFKSNLQLLLGLSLKKKKLESWQSVSQQVMRAIPLYTNSTLVSLKSSLVSLSSTPVSVSIISWGSLRLCLLLELGSSGLHGTYVSWNMQAMQAIPVSLHKIPVSLHVHSTPVSQMVHHVAFS